MSHGLTTASERGTSLFDRLRVHRIGVLVCAILAVDTYVVANAIGCGKTLSNWTGAPWSSIEYGRWQSTDVLILALACSQISLLMVWASFGSSTRTLKTLTCLGALGLWVAAVSSVLNASWAAWSDLAPLFLSQSATVLLGCGWLRRCGYHLQQQAEELLPRSPRRKQFTLEEMFLCLSAAAVLCTACSWLSWLDISRLGVWRTVNWYWRDIPSLIWISGQGFGCGICGCLAAWACLATGRLAIRSAILFLTSGITAWLVVNTSFHYRIYQGLNSEPELLTSWLFWFVLQASLLCVVLFTVRAAGYRLAMCGGDVNSHNSQLLLRRRLAWGLAMVAIAACALAYFDGPRTAFLQYRRNLFRFRETIEIGALDKSGQMSYTLTVNRPLDTEIVEILSRYTEIDAIAFIGPSTLTGNSVRQLGQLQHLRQISIRDADLSDHDLACFRELHDLQSLVFIAVNITDDGLHHLRPLKSLVDLRFLYCPVTQLGVQRLETWLPNTVIQCNQYSSANRKRNGRPAPDGVSAK